MKRRIAEQRAFLAVLQLVDELPTKKLLTIIKGAEQSFLCFVFDERDLISPTHRRVHAQVCNVGHVVTSFHAKFPVIDCGLQCGRDSKNPIRKHLVPVLAI